MGAGGKTFRALIRLAVCSAFVVLASGPGLSAQNVILTGALSGRVTDQSGAVVPGASVVVRNLETGVKQSANTSNAGLYRFPVLMPGSYSIMASFKGFRDAQGLVRVRVGNTTLQEIKLQVGSKGDTIKVSETIPFVQLMPQGADLDHDAPLDQTLA